MRARSHIRRYARAIHRPPDRRRAGRPGQRPRPSACRSRAARPAAARARRCDRDRSGGGPDARRPARLQSCLRGGDRALAGAAAGAARRRRADAAGGGGAPGGERAGQRAGAGRAGPPRAPGAAGPVGGGAPGGRAGRGGRPLPAAAGGGEPGGAAPARAALGGHAPAVADPAAPDGVAPSPGQCALGTAADRAGPQPRPGRRRRPACPGSAGTGRQSGQPGAGGPRRAGGAAAAVTQGGTSHRPAAEP
jgi:hypothetical protein